jgi:hypothetical protein
MRVNGSTCHVRRPATFGEEANGSLASTVDARLQPRAPPAVSSPQCRRRRGRA